MNSFCPSRPNVVIAKDEEKTIELPFMAGRSRVLRSVRILHDQNHLLQANKSMERFMGQQNGESADPIGRVLRRMRTQKGLDAFVVASKACITVSQLYELEVGQDSLFYTPGLRLKAAQRVAAILGLDWQSNLSNLQTQKPIPGPTARLHVLDTPLMHAHLKTIPTPSTPATPPKRPPCRVAESLPLSCAPFLRVVALQD